MELIRRLILTESVEDRQRVLHGAEGAAAQAEAFKVTELPGAPAKASAANAAAPTVATSGRAALDQKQRCAAPNV